MWVGKEAGGGSPHIGVMVVSVCSPLSGAVAIGLCSYSDFGSVLMRGFLLLVIWGAIPGMFLLLINHHSLAISAL